MLPTKEFLGLLNRILANDPNGSIVPLLPLIFRLKNKPYSLEYSHFMFEPLYHLKNIPRRMVWKTGRQCSKSTSLAASQIIMAALIPHFNQLTVTPLYEQVRRFSQNYVRPFISGSPFRDSLFRGESNIDNVLQRTLANMSSLFYGYSQGDPDRLRGLNLDAILADEVADLDTSDLPIIESGMSASPYKLVKYTGTPKTFDNTLSLLWEDSSQGVWHIPCHNVSCGHLNRGTVPGDLLEMVGETTLSCAKCKKPINSRLGRFIHDFPSRVKSFAGYHVSQPILPMHYDLPKNWRIITDFRKEKPVYQFYNEILGLAFDSGSKLITAEELRNAATALSVPPELTHTVPSIMTTIGVDFGGKGKEKSSDTDDFISNTAIAIANLTPTGVVDISWYYKTPYTMDINGETEVIVRSAMASRSAYLALDAGGQGNVRESMILSAGWPADKIVPFTYAVMANNRPIVYYNPPQVRGVRSSYTLDKPRSLLLLCELIKRGLVRLPNDPRYLDDHLKDFLNIIEESTDSPSGSPRRLVKRLSRRTDDIVNATNYAVMAIYHATGAWPDLANSFIRPDQT